MATILGNAFFVNMLIRHEQAISRLYEVLAEKVPKSKSFWNHIHLEEDRHADLLQGLAEEVKLGLSGLSAERLPTSKVKEAVDFIEPRTRSWSSWGVTPQYAFNFALMLEGSLIEHQVLVPVDGDSCYATSVLNSLRRHTEEHVLRLQEEARKYANRNWFARLISKFKSN